jgi:thiol-disulfide isomerase/thioredoxin
MLFEFYGQECPHCHAMKPWIEKLEKEEGVKVEKYEVWHSEENLAKMRPLAEGRCMGVPFYFNTETKEFICGEADYDTLKKWAGK